jgi:RecA/RadA recombinase
MFGPESTGKTTLSIQLAAHYQTGARVCSWITYKKSGIKVKVFAMSMDAYCVRSNQVRK